MIRTIRCLYDVPFKFYALGLFIAETFVTYLAIPASKNVSFNHYLKIRPS